MLTKNKYKKLYRTYKDNIERDFYVPSFSESIILDRAAGYFSLNSLALSIDGLIRFIQNNGHMRLMCSPDLSQADAELIDLCVSLDNERVTRSMIETVTNTQLSDEEAYQMDIICNMITERRLEIKIAYMPLGIYHEKFGIFKDEAGNTVYFNGSMNETKRALKYNHESIVVESSWKVSPEESLCSSEEENFQCLWDGQDDDIVTMDFPEAVKENILNIYKRSDSLRDAINNYICHKSSGKKSLYPYQEQAIKEFCQNGYRHFYEMATGTGKTYTSVKTIQRLALECEEKLFIVICVPQIDLQVQWAKALNDEGYNDLYLFGGNGNPYDINISKALIAYNTEDENVICVAVYDTFFAKMYSRIRNIDNMFLIVDEAHNLTPGNLKTLSGLDPQYRLGLSATIQRHCEDESNAIVEFFTPGKTFYYGIEDAIENNFLSHYEYYPIFVRLTEDENEKFNYKTKLLAQELNKKEPDEDVITKLRRDRSLILKQASEKINKLDEMAHGDYNFVNSVVYCGQGTDDEGESIIDSVTKILSRNKLVVSQFTSKTQDRKRVLYEFENGYFDTLAAIRCFDEGVDVPKLDKIYIMASDSALRQTVQRRGRVLRKCKESGKTIAYIYDMVVLPATAMGTYNCSSLLNIELLRAREYNRLANNKDANENIFKNIENEYHITINEDIDYDTESN